METRLSLQGGGFDGIFMQQQYQDANNTVITEECVVSYPIPEETSSNSNNNNNNNGVVNHNSIDQKPGLHAVQPFVFHNEVGAVGITRMDLRKVTITAADQWRQVSATAAFSPRAGHQIQALADGSVMLTGGEDEQGPNGETWRWLPLICPDRIMDTSRELNCQGLQVSHHAGQFF